MGPIYRYAIAAVCGLVLALVAALPAMIAWLWKPDPVKYTIQFVACDTPDCMHQSYVEQAAPWKFVRDGECKSYYKHAFPGWCYKYVETCQGRRHHGSGGFETRHADFSDF